MLATSKNCVDMHSYNRPMKNILLLTKYCKSPILHLKKRMYYYSHVTDEGTGTKRAGNLL